MIPQWPESQKVALADRIIHALRKHLPEIQRLPKWRRLPQLEAENKAANLFVILISTCSPYNYSTNKTEIGLGHQTNREMPEYLKDLRTTEQTLTTLLSNLEYMAAQGDSSVVVACGGKFFPPADLISSVVVARGIIKEAQSGFERRRKALHHAVTDACVYLTKAGIPCSARTDQTVWKLILSSLWDVSESSIFAVRRAAKTQ